MAAPTPTRQKSARDRLARLFAHPASIFVVHYACESFEQGLGYASPRITSIAFRNLASGATTSFSIHQQVELARRRSSDVALMDNHEHAMLGRYFDFLNTNRNVTLLHWNMRDEKFGFAAIEHRFELLGGQPILHHDSQRVDLARLMLDLYGTGYVERPYFENLAVRNGLSQSGLQSGAAEAEAFQQGQYYKVLQSTLSKVALIADVAQLSFDGTLKTEASWWTLNGGQFREAYELCWRNPLRALSSLMLGLSGGAFLLVMKLLG